MVRVRYCGQTFVDFPATVIGQQSSGQIRIFAAFVSEGMSLRRHLEECVKPWLSANVFRPTLLGGLEDADPQVSSDMRRTINEILGAGEWTTIQKPWESRRDAMLDALSKAMPFTFKPILQLDPVNARPLIEGAGGGLSKKSGATRKTLRGVANALTLQLLEARCEAKPKDPRRMLPPSWMSV
jgi:hypothetical protein